MDDEWNDISYRLHPNQKAGSHLPIEDRIFLDRLILNRPQFLI